MKARTVPASKLPKPAKTADLDTRGLSAIDANLGWLSAQSNRTIQAECSK